MAEMSGLDFIQQQQKDQSFQPEPQAGAEPSGLDYIGSNFGNQGSALQFAQSTNAGANRPQDLFDVTIGATEHGAAESAGLLAKGIDRSFISSQPLVRFAKEMDDFQRNHPEYAPTEVHSAMELIQSPAALTSRVFHGAPMLAATVGATALGGVVPTAALLYTTEAQRGYEDAIQAGASPDRAEAAGFQMGVVNAGIQILTQQRLLKFARGEEGSFAREVTRRAGKISTAGSLTADLAGEATMAAFYGSLQGAVDDGIALYQYKKDVAPEFWDRRIQDAVGGATAGAVFGVVGKGGRKIFKDFVLPEAGGGEKKISVEQNVYDRDSFAEHLVKNYKMAPDDAVPVTEVVDAFARSWADRNQQPVPKFYGEYVDQQNVTPETKSNGDAIAKDAENVPKLFLGEKPEGVLKSLVDIATVKMSPADKTTYEKSLGSSDPAVINRHLFDYLKSGEAPAPELVEPFEALKQTFKDVWFTTKDEVKSDTPLPVKGVFDSLFSVDTDQIKEARAKLGDALTQQKTIEQQAQAPVSDFYKDEPSLAPGSPEEQQRAAQVVGDMQLELKRLQLGRELPERDSAVARRAALDGTARETLRSETDTERKTRGRIGQAMDFFHTMWDEAAPLRHFSWGRKALDLISTIKNKQGTMEGQFANANWEAYNNLSLRDKLWLNFVDETEAGKTDVRMSNFQRFIDLAGVPNPISEAPNPALNAYREQVRNINTSFGRMAEADATTFKLKDGTVVNYQQPDTLRMIRHLTPEVRNAIQTKHGPVWDELKRVLLKAHEDEGLKLGSVESALSDAVKGQGISTAGPLTEGRVLKTMPTEVKLENGQIVQILNTHPYHYLQSATRVQAYQIAWNQTIRQNHLDPVKKAYLKDLTQQLGIMPVFGVKDIVSMIEAKTGEGSVPEAMKEDVKALKAHLKALDPTAQTSPTVKAYRQAMDKLNPVDLSESQINTLRFFAKKLGGVDANAHPIDLLSEIKKRTVEKPIDIIKSITDNLTKEGGNPEVLTKVIKMSQGIPVHMQGIELNPVYRGVKFVGSIIGIGHTSLSVLLNIPQTLTQVLPAVGLKNFVRAIDASLRDYRGTRDTQVALGAIQSTHLAWMFEKGRTLEGIGKALKQAVYYGTGMKFIADVNNVVAGEAFRQKAIDWKNGGFGGKDENLARTLRLNSQEIKNLKAGNVDDLLFNKIVQNGIARTQFVTESAHNRGYLENHPLTSMLFNYQNYTLGTTRILGDYVKGIRDVFTKRDPAHAANMMYRTALMIGGGMGAKVAGDMLRSIIRGDASHDDTETTKDKWLGAIAALNLLGPTTRVMDAMKYDQGSLDTAFAGLMPQVKALRDGLGLLANAAGAEYGRYGKMSIGQQAKQLALQNTPLAKSVNTWMENVAYPDVTRYKEVRANSTAWLANTGGIKPQPGIQQVNPEYDTVFQWVKRGDQEKAVQTAVEYYTKYANESEKLAQTDPIQFAIQKRSMQAARSGLRSSLESRAPIHTDARLLGLYVSTLPPAKRDAYLQAQAKYINLVNMVAPKE